MKIERVREILIQREAGDRIPSPSIDARIGVGNGRRVAFTGEHTLPLSYGNTPPPPSASSGQIESVIAIVGGRLQIAESSLESREQQNVRLF
ncbi:hypothetical protein CDAR_30371 [Caerostris darwini]|uniref:Uncharacterized protein n=1 Tax=Caerostris darwini TaxID=1538125 RepID=A0AAV4VVK1_9ARAC|nr:hypothetical protein CDAR_30371 [Caerostris darwini]